MFRSLMTIIRELYLYLTKVIFMLKHLVKLESAVAQWLRCCATNGKVAGSIPTGVIGIIHYHRVLPIALWPWGRTSL